MSLQEFLIYLTTGGSIIVVSWLAEKSAKFKELSKEVKEYIIYGASLLLSLGAYSVNTYVDPSVLEKLAPIFSIAATLFESVFLGQLYHFFAKSKKQ